MCRQHGIDLTFTQMLHAKNLVRDRVFSRNHLDVYEYGGLPTKPTDSLLESQQNLLQGATNEPGDNAPVSSDWKRWTRGPVIVQLAGHDADVVLAAAQMVVDHTDEEVHGIDLNLGTYLHDG
jgi:tRNA-dihydrouridine synthase